MKTTGLLNLSLCAAAFAMLAGCVGAPEELDNGTDELEPTGEASSAITVEQAVSAGCSTSSVKGLSLQIIAEGNCITPGAFSAVPARPNLSVAANVFLVLEQPARDRLVNALNTHSGTTMSLTSMFRTVAQQFLLFRWFQLGTCGIQLAATPGNSNHETGLALDVSNFSSWNGKLPNFGFTWLGNSDPVHFDYTGTGAVNHKGLDVKAFQRLWNRNKPSDPIAVDGIWGPQTEARMKQSPAGGFAIGAQCAAGLEFMAEYEAAAAMLAEREAVKGDGHELTCGADIHDPELEAEALESASEHEEH